MVQITEYSPRERLFLGLVAAAGFLGVNGVFLYALIFKPETLAQAMANPVSAAFMAEALILVAVLAYLLRKWKVARLSWGWFVALSLVGSIAFALPVVLLWPPKARRGSGFDAPDRETSR